MTKHKTEDYKISSVKYYLNNDKGDGYKKTVKFLIVRNLLYEIGFRSSRISLFKIRHVSFFSFTWVMV